jgi:hypothetical protein
MRERNKAVECVQVAEELRCQTFLVDDLLGNAREPRVLRETRPCATAHALQVDRGDLSVGRRGRRTFQIDGCAHLATPKRALRLSKPVF